MDYFDFLRKLIDKILAVSIFTSFLLYSFIQKTLKENDWVKSGTTKMRIWSTR